MTDKKDFELTRSEKAWIAIKRYNETTGGIKYVFYGKIDIGRLAIIIEWRSKRNLWGRFGGGWDWKIGLQWSKQTLIISLLVLEITCLRR